MRDVFRGDMRGTNLIAAGLGDVPILAEETAHVAASGAQGKNLCARQEMIERLLFDRINLQRGERAVTQAIELAAAVHADKAEAGLAFADVAVARTQIAVNTAVGFGFPPAGLVQSFCFLKNLQAIHELWGTPTPGFFHKDVKTSYLRGVSC